MTAATPTHDELLARVAQLERQQQQQSVEPPQATATADLALRERVKELTCLYGISALVELPDLSLAICKHVVTALGGEIRGESEVGKGTRVVVRLPVQPEGKDERLAEVVPKTP